MTSQALFKQKLVVEWNCFVSKIIIENNLLRSQRVYVQRKWVDNFDTKHLTKVPNYYILLYTNGILPVTVVYISICWSL